MAYSFTPTAAQAAAAAASLYSQPGSSSLQVDPNAAAVASYYTAMHHQLTSLPQTSIDWSGMQMPMKEPDAATGPGGTAGTGNVQQQQQAGGKTDGPPASYEQWAYVYQQQVAAAAAMAAQQAQYQTTATFADAHAVASTGAVTDMQAYSTMYAGAGIAHQQQQQQAAAYYYASSDPSMMQFPMVGAPAPMPMQSTQLAVLPTQAATQLQPSAQAAWQGALSPSRLAQAAQLHKGFGSTGHGAGQQAIGHGATWRGRSARAADRVLPLLLLQSRAHAIVGMRCRWSRSTKVGPTPRQVHFASNRSASHSMDRRLIERHWSSCSFCSFSFFEDPLTYKTEICRTHLATGHCDYGSAHVRERSNATGKECLVCSIDGADRLCLVSSSSAPSAVCPFSARRVSSLTA